MQLNDARDLARRLMDEHGLSQWRLEFDRAKRRAGVCRHDRRTIGLSAPVTRLHPEEEVRDTILHEIAHALAGARAGHGPAWVEVARRIGCSAQRCVPEDLPQVPGAWVGTCPQGHTHQRHRRPERVLLCGRCRELADLDRVLDWLHHGRPAAMHPNYTAELAALRKGSALVRFGRGVPVRITVPGGFEGKVGVVVKRGRTRYQVRLPDGAVTVPFAGVERVG